MPDDDDDWTGARKPERETLLGTREWYEQVVVNKVDGLSREQATQLMTPSGMSPLGIVKHLAWAEAGWFRDTFAGEEGFTEVSNEESFVIADQDTIESVVAAFRDECARSRAIIDAAGSLDDLSAREAWFRGRVSLRWVIVHLIEEVARHVGHLDIMREQIDGKTGD